LGGRENPRILVGVIFFFLSWEKGTGREWMKGGLGGVEGQGRGGECKPAPSKMETCGQPQFIKYNSKLKGRRGGGG